jgi:hypothetical protein
MSFRESTPNSAGKAGLCLGSRIFGIWGTRPPLSENHFFQELRKTGSNVSLSTAVIAMTDTGRVIHNSIKAEQASPAASAN